MLLPQTLPLQNPNESTQNHLRITLRCQIQTNNSPPPQQLRSSAPCHLVRRPSTRFSWKTSMKTPSLELSIPIWKQKLVQMGAKIETQLSDKVTHVFAISSNALLHRINEDQLARFKGWLEDSLAAGEKVSEDFYTLKVDPAGLDVPDKSQKPKLANRNSCDYDEQLNCKRIKSSPEEIKQTNEERKGDIETNSASATSDTEPHSPSSVPSSPENLSTQDKDVGTPTPLQHSPPDFNKDITEIFGKLVNIYRGETCFSERAVMWDRDCGIFMQIQEIVTTGKLSKLGHFETDEKVRTISLFGEVWGVGPTTTLKLYEKGHHTLNDLKNEDSLTNSQVIGLKYFDDIKIRVPRHEAQHMESLLQKVAYGIVLGEQIKHVDKHLKYQIRCSFLEIYNEKKQIYWIQIKETCR
ncbi:DNA polymerase lambda isoform 2 [Hibiscus syriacus]|uniref:DNA polymerase lambda isoform 2 n=1 Tax=Hibiscus syriacus TaxID=106335 RepID=A0A6A3AMG8_HIBSY|nr:DNA polymerase lambda isoform 2 [Hibiscus syriacus]